MPSASGVRAGKAYVEIGGKDTLSPVLSKIGRKFQAFGAGLRDVGLKAIGLGAGIVMPLLWSVREFARAGDELDKMGARIGASVEFLSALNHAAQLGGTSMDAMEVGIRRLQRTAYDSTQGLKAATDAFDTLGVTVTDAQGNLKPTEQLFMESATALSQLKNNTQKAALATIIFGRAGTQLLPMLRDGEEGLAAMMEEAKRLGLVMTGADAKAAADLTDQMERLTSVLKMGIVRIGAALAPLMMRVADSLIGAATAARKWIDEHQRVVMIALQAGVALVAFGTALAAVGVAVSALGKVFSILGAILPAVGAAFGLIGSLLGALLSPIGLVLGTVIALGGWFLWTSNVGAEALAWLGARAGVLKDEFSAMLDGIRAALAGGDLGAAAKVLWAFLRLEWVRGKNALLEIWSGFGRGWIQSTEDWWHAAQLGLTTAWTYIRRVWIETVGAMRQVWAEFSATFQTIWEGTQNWLIKRLHELHGYLDSSFDAKAAKELTDQTTSQVQAEIERRRQAALVNAETARAANLKELEADHAARLLAIGQKSDEAARRARPAAGRELAAREAELVAAQFEFGNALTAARMAEGAARQKAAAKAPKLAVGIKNLAAWMPEQVSVAGTFSSTALRGLGTGGGIQARMLGKLDEIAANAKKIAQAAQNGMAFGD